MAALDDALPLLRCPTCGADLTRAAGVVSCAAGHSFDVARQGYVSLLGGGRAGGARRTGGEGPRPASPRRAPSGDSPDMVAARERFLDAGHFQPLAGALGDLLEHAFDGRGSIVDLGAGTGWYLAGLLDRFPEATGVALDVSKPALRRAARAHPRAAAVGCDAWGPLPLRDHVAGAVLNVFAPRNASEIARVLAPAGAALVVTPTPSHLEELVRPLGLIGVDPGKEARLADQLAVALDVVERRDLRWRMRLDRDGALAAAAMGPSAFHVSADQLDERAAALPERLDVTAAVTISLTRAAERRARPRAPAGDASDRGPRRTQPGFRPPRSPGGTG
jgi:23S rRNA (guanine745-N1)-methyltransferase